MRYNIRIVDVTLPINSRASNILYIYMYVYKRPTLHEVETYINKDTRGRDDYQTVQRMKMVHEQLPSQAGFYINYQQFTRIY